MTDDYKCDFEAMKAMVVKFYGEPKEEMWGIAVVFEDLYGNVFDLVQRFERNVAENL
jgi:hypothetical protein